MREKIEFFVKLLGASKVEEVLEDYTIKNYKGGDRTIKVGRPVGSVNKKKKKIFPNGMHYWTPTEEKELVDLAAELKKQGLRGHKFAVELSRPFGVSYRAGYARLRMIQKNGTKSIQPERERVSS